MSDDYDPLAQKAESASQSSGYDPLAQAAQGNPPQATTQQPSAFDSWVGRPVGLLGRAVATGVGALPTLAMDSGVAIRNLVGDWANKELGNRPTADYELPSQMFQDALTQAGFPVPKTAIEKGTGLVESTMSGAATPQATVESNVPSNFLTPAQLQSNANLQAVRDGMGAGYRVPPATTNPSMLNTGIETVAGKLATQNAASRLNQPITDMLAHEAVGLDPRVPLTDAGLDGIIKEASQDYAAMSKVPKVNLDQQFKDALKDIVDQHNSVAAEVPELANKDISPIADGLASKDSLSGKALVGSVRRLRDLADSSFRAGDGGTGLAYKKMASALENAADRDLPQDSGLVDAWRSARQRIAIAKTVQDALNPGTGHVRAAAIGKALQNGEPLSGSLLTIGRFANAVPKAVQEPTSSPISHLDIVGSILGGLGAALGHGSVPTEVAGAMGAAAYPAARMAAKQLALGPLQSNVLPAEASGELPWMVRAAPTVYAESQ